MSMASQLQTDYTILVGCYNGPTTKGLYSFDIDLKIKETPIITKTGHLPIDNPSTFIQVPNSELIYSVSESNPKTDIGAYLIQYSDSPTDNNKLSLIGKGDVGGAGPCSITLLGSSIITANYDGGSISIIPVTTPEERQENPSLVFKTPQVLPFKLDKIGPDPTRQEKNHLHCVRFTPDEKYLVATDLGADKLYIYALDQNKRIINIEKPAEYKLYPGCGPRHIEFDTEGRFIYVITELHGTIDVLHIQLTSNDDDHGVSSQKPSDNDDSHDVSSLKPRSNDDCAVSWLKPCHPDVPIELDRFQLVLAEPHKQRGSADIHISKDGKFLYTSHRSTDNDHEDVDSSKFNGISIFSRNFESGQLTSVNFQETKRHPRQFTISPDDKYLFVACRDDNCIQVFKRDIDTGLLEETNEMKIDIESPVWVEFRLS